MLMLVSLALGAILALLADLQYKINRKMENIMAAISDLNAAIDTLTATVTSVQTDVAEAITLIQAGQGGDSDALQAAVDKLTALNATLSSSDASLKAVEPAS